MIDDDYNGLAGILGVAPPRKKPKVLTPEDPLMDFASTLVRMKPLELPKNVLKKDEYGYTPAQNREINNYLTRPEPSKLENSKIFENNINRRKGTGARTESNRVMSNPKVREENAIERIDRINYEFDQTKVRPRHLDNKSIVSWEDKQKAVIQDESKLNQPKRRQ